MKPIYSIVVFLLLFSTPSAAQMVELNVPCPVSATYASGGAEYRSGVDAYGEAVASADINAPVKALTYPIKIPVELDLLRFLDLDIPASAKNALNIDEVNIVHFELFEDGRIEYNGQDLSDQVSQSCDEEDNDHLGQEEEGHENSGHEKPVSLGSEPPDDGLDGEPLDGQYP